RDFHVTGVQTCALPISRLLRCARREGLAGVLAHRLRGAGAWERVPAQVRTILADAEIAIARSHVVAGWEARQAAAALRPLGCPEIRRASCREMETQAWK